MAGPAEDRGVFDLERPVPDRTVTWGAHPDAIVDVHGSDDSPAVVALVHGGFWHPDYDRHHLRPMAGALAAAGMQAIVVEYRREPGSPDASVDDVRAGLETAAVLAAGRPLVVAGHSAGGQLALAAIVRSALPGIERIVALAPVADLLEAERLDLDDGAVRRFLGVEAHSRPDLDPMRLPIPSAPVVVLHGASDARVPIAMGRAYAERAGGSCIELAEVGHFEPIDPGHAVWPAVVALLSVGSAPTR